MALSLVPGLHSSSSPEKEEKEEEEVRTTDENDRGEEKRGDKERRVESVSYMTLNVTVLRAKTETNQDFWSQSDLYVTLTLPTAMATIRRTKTINHNNQPVWNEGFSFRVPTKTKNVLEIRLFDEDLLSKDDLISTVLLDLETLELDSKICRSFSLNPETQDALEVEFELTNSEEETQEYLSNGILMAAPLSVLNVKVQKLLHTHLLWCSPMLTLCGAYEKVQPLDPDTDKLVFHMNRELETQLALTVSIYSNICLSEVKVTEEIEVEKQNVVFSSVLKLLPSRHSGHVSLSVDQDTVDLHLELNDRSLCEDGVGVRLSEDVSAQEKNFLYKRKTRVSQALQALLHLQSVSPHDKVPTVAVVVSGGGARACTGLLGSLKALKDMGVLDAVSYITVLSGSTWSMSALCQDENWSQNLESLMPKIREQMTKSMMSAFTPEKLHYYYTEMEKKEKQGHLVSYIDMAGLIAEHYVFGQKNSSTLSDQKKTVKNGQNPLPIYTAVNVKEAIHGNQPEAEWVEFTPFEVGMQKYGAFIKAENFGSEFFLGHLIKKLPELRLPFLMDSHPDAFPNQLTPSDPTLHLIDSGHSINIGCPPVLRPERRADVIIILSYSWDPGNIFKVLQKTCEFCEEHQMPFPSPDFAELQKQPQREVYVCEAPENPEAPIVLLLPLVNASFRDHKAPGVRRETEEELAAGQVDVSSSGSPYTTQNMTYSEEDYDALIRLTHYNATHSRDAVLSALAKALSRLTPDP
ncbi:cytosolic phospholipase A2 epsilon-like [Boleophthalmus pectinirostris]|uniref:cytosolic phospholipase A2 epsilon-like n=1 Tax=Boleophthalmus pectinirostris TaxID=150288 RepID=UPI00242C8915|nr:cytosolic phospholipase A2 epsilon-like [Boleophthalmus pectinirostris]